MKKRLLIAFALLALLTVFVGCQPDDGDDEIINDTVIEGEIITEADTVDEGDVVTFVIPEDATPITPTTTADGYRIQLVASSTEAAAQRVAGEAEAVLGAPAYISYEGGYWKVRVGNCATRMDAESLRSQARSSGYGDAWISACQIVQ